jgi:DNA repair protein SbcD/Mre11
MPREPVRFLHAARLMLDHQLRGLLDLPEPWQETVRDAASIAFDRLIDACLDHQVDFLLVTGDSFDARDGSLRAQAALARGLNRLAEHGIPSYLCCGNSDPWNSWMPQIRFAPEVHILGTPDCPEPCIVLRNSRVIATIDCVRHVEQAMSSVESGGVPIHEDSSSRNPIAIRMSGPDSPAVSGTGFDYLAQAGACPRRTTIDGSLTMHYPGPLQGASSADSGICGATLVEVPAEGAPQLTLIPTAPVRWEDLTLHLTTVSPDEIVEQMHWAAGQIEPSPAEQLRLLTWDLYFHGSPPLLLADPVSRRRAIEAACNNPSGSAPPAITVATHLHVHSFTETLQDTASPLARDFRRQLDAKLSEPGWSPAQCLAESALCSGPWQTAMESALAGLNRDDVAWEAKRLVGKWFAAAEELSA